MKIFSMNTNVEVLCGVLVNKKNEIQTGRPFFLINGEWVKGYWEFGTPTLIGYLTLTSVDFSSFTTISETFQYNEGRVIISKLK